MVGNDMVGGRGGVQWGEVGYAWGWKEGWVRWVRGGGVS